ncbi:MAG: calcium-binding protein [Planctomycetota bacterium]
MKTALATGSAVLMLLSGSATAQDFTIRVNVATSGEQANAVSNAGSLSADGRYVGIVSAASNLVPGDTNARSDVFVRDVQASQTDRVSVDSNGYEGNGDSYFAKLSSDARYVAFSSWATNLVPGDTNNVADIFVHDRQTRFTTRVSLASSGVQGNGASGLYGLGLSADGRYVAFSSDASNLVGGDTNGVTDIFVYDRQTLTVVRASVGAGGAQGNGPSSWPWISADGRYVEFMSVANNLVPGDTNNAQDVFVHDLKTGQTTRISVDSAGKQGNGECASHTLSGDGRHAAFWSAATNLVAGDTNGKWDVFVHDLQTGETTRVSVDTNGAQGNDDSNGGALSADGRYVAFHSRASNLGGGTNGLIHVFVHDRQMGCTTLASVDSTGVQANGDSTWPDISADGQYLSFTSAASNLVASDTNACDDVFRRDWCPTSWHNYGPGWPGTNGIPSLTASGDPVLCTAITLYLENSSGAPTRAVFLAGPTEVYWPTALGGVLLVYPQVVVPMALPAGVNALPVDIPCDCGLGGLAIYLQVLEQDPGASQGASFTRGLALVLGR